jgi:PKD repeat protein
MRTITLLARRAAALALAGATVLALPACDPSTLSDDQRRAVTGTTDVGQLTLTVDEREATVNEAAQVFHYHLNDIGLTGRVTLSLSGLTSDLELVQPLTPSEFDVSDPDGNGKITHGTFSVRALATRSAPVDLRLSMVSVGVGGSRVDHPPVTIRLHLDGSPLAVQCSRDPGAGIAPLAVRFDARPSGCAEDCALRWDFGDGTGSDEPRVEHRYDRPGRYDAVVVLREGGRTATCTRTVEVAKPDQEPSPSAPSPTGTAPSADFTIHASATTIDLDASASTGHIVLYTWDLSWTSAKPDASSGSPTASFPSGEVVGTITLTVTAADGQTATRTVPFPH